MVEKLDKQRFDEALKKSGKPVVVDFSADWCPHCRMLAPTIEELAVEYANEIDVYYVDTEDNQDLADQYEIMTIPTVYVFSNGEAVGNVVNPKSKEALRKLIFSQ